MKLKKPFFIILYFVLSVSLWAGNYVVEKSSSLVAVDGKASPPHTFTSVVTDYEYDIDVDPQSMDVNRANFSFSFADMDSEKSKRDKKMLDWMESESYPKAAFTLTKIIDREGQKVGLGTFNMHGIDRDIEVPFTISKEGNTVFIDGVADFSYEDWNLDIIRLFIFSVKPEMHVHFHLAGHLASAG